MWNSEPEQELVPFSSASHMAAVYKECTAKIRAAFDEIQEQVKQLDRVFLDTLTIGSDFGMSLEYHGERYNRGELDKLFIAYSRTAWRVLSDRLGIKKIMSIAARQQFEEQLRKGELPAISEETIIGVLQGWCNQSSELAKGSHRGDIRLAPSSP